MMNALISGKLDGGIPKGRVTLFAGESGVGKSYMAMKIVAAAQKKGMRCIVFDTENAVDEDMARHLGADPSKIKWYPPRSIEEMRNAIFALLDKIIEMENEHRKDPSKPSMQGKVLIVIDSVANAISELEIKRMGKDSTSADMGTVSKAVKSLLKTCTVYGQLTQTTFLVTNHIYDNPNEMYPDLVKCMPGGKACRYLPSVVLQLAKRNIKEKESGEADTAALGKGIAGIEMRGMCVKNRFIRPLMEGSLYLSWKNGLDHTYGMMDLAKELGVLVPRGAVYDLYDGTQLGYAKNWKQDSELWDKTIYPEIQRRLDTTWSYKSDDEVAEEQDELDMLNSDENDVVITQV